MDDVTWAALALALTVLGGVYTWWAFRRRGTAVGLRGLALTLLPAAAWLTGTLEMFTRIGRAVGDWATSLVLSPTVWAGVTAAGASVLLWLASLGLDRWRPVERGRSRGRGEATSVSSGPSRAQPLPGASPTGEDEFADIEELLRRKGIQ